MRSLRDGLRPLADSVGTPPDIDELAAPKAAHPPRVAVTVGIVAVAVAALVVGIVATRPHNRPVAAVGPVGPQDTRPVPHTHSSTEAATAFASEVRTALKANLEGFRLQVAAETFGASSPNQRPLVAKFTNLGGQFVKVSTGYLLPGSPTAQVAPGSTPISSGLPTGYTAVDMHRKRGEYLVAVVKTEPDGLHYIQILADGGLGFGRAQLLHPALELAKQLP